LVFGPGQSRDRPRRLSRGWAASSTAATRTSAPAAAIVPLVNALSFVVSSVLDRSIAAPRFGAVSGVLGLRQMVLDGIVYSVT
jgi:hypothetical protein